MGKVSTALFDFFIQLTANDFSIFTASHMANIGQEQPSIRNMQVVSSNRVHSTQSCEANECRIFKPFFFVYQIKGF